MGFYKLCNVPSDEPVELVNDEPSGLDGDKPQAPTSTAQQPSQQAGGPERMEEEEEPAPPAPFGEPECLAGSKTSLTIQ